MKNIKNKKILPVLIFLFFLMISNNLALAATEYWWFQDIYKTPICDSLTIDKNGKACATQEICNTARNNYIKRNFTNATIGYCYQGQIDGTILVSQVNNNSGINTTPSTNNNSGTPVSLTPGKEGPTANTTYKLLAPLPGGLVSVDNGTKIGEYFNTMITVIIGLCAVLAVVMLVVGGVQYMGSESIFGKTDAKSQMTKAIFGLFIAIGAYALLNTINPALLGKNGLTVKQVSAEIEEVPLITYEKGDYTKECAEFVDIEVKYGDGTVGNPRDTINICKSISTKLASMINAAYKNTPALKISGVGSRSIATQKFLRAKYCGGTTNIYNPNAKCSQSVAIPGTSNHEKGLAIDITCNGGSPGKTDTSNPCYVWLTKNAKDYGFKNNYNDLKETWHWSTTGN